MEIICLKAPGTLPGACDEWTDRKIYIATQIGDSLTYRVRDDTGKNRVVVLERETGLLPAGFKYKGRRKQHYGKFVRKENYNG